MVLLTYSGNLDFGDQLVLADFGTTWCKPCKELLPVLEELDKSMDITIVKIDVDVDEHTKLAMDYDVTTLPQICIMRNGKVLDKITSNFTLENIQKRTEIYS